MEYLKMFFSPVFIQKKKKISKNRSSDFPSELDGIVERSYTVVSVPPF